MKQYEALFVIDAEKEPSFKDITDAITGTLKKNNATISKEENWGRQKLAYSVKKKKEAIYYKVEFSVDPSKISTLNSAYKLNSDILRVMISNK